MFQHPMRRFTSRLRVVTFRFRIAQMTSTGTQMARTRTAADLLDLRGSYKHDPQRRRAPLLGHGDIGAWRTGSNDPSEIWRELVDIAPDGLLVAADRPALEAATLLLARMRSRPMDVTPAMITALFNALGKLGLSPHGRSQLSAPPPREEPDPALEEFTLPEQLYGR
jgi:hypothetical protein